MKLTIEITNETAAAIWANNHRPASIATIISTIVEANGCRYRHVFPEEFIHDLSEFKDTDAAKELTE